MLLKEYVITTLLDDYHLLLIDQDEINMSLIIVHHAFLFLIVAYSLFIYIYMIINQKKNKYVLLVIE